jgi:hypothetical protein
MFSQKTVDTYAKIKQQLIENGLEVVEVYYAPGWLNYKWFSVNGVDITMFESHDKWCEYPFGTWNNHVSQSAVQLQISPEGEFINWCINTYPEPIIQKSNLFDYLKSQLTPVS